LLSKQVKSVSEKDENSRSGNRPLGFSLELDSRHSWFDELCLAEETVKEYGLDYCAKGYLKDHIAFPIHSREGDIVAHGGMTMDDDNSEYPDYKYPALDKFDPSLELLGLYQALQRGQAGVIYLVRTPLQVFQP
jgi:hypothetical protein